MSQVALRLPDSLHQHAKQLAAQDDASLNQFIVTAVAEKISALNTEAFFQERARRSDQDKAVAALAKVRRLAPQAGDER
ncbi:YlcI/YnfO family protein [Rhodoferax sp. U11-2br]|uniref:YlcI/YnfO family protein n=1 Tax=Rhodoferax sp. U11-2br TaxID=2838878 RepID=UPI001BEC0072|nr:YlcI/YnfO family protein [Rhodoferax sp. U11-2br]MBT3065423.1 toxin-antitoxin system HicB family antitoxin [Rhodoferax sp. U11-2br]